MFKVGDKVEVIDGNSYKLTKTGSYGTIISIEDDVATVDFHYIINPDSDSRKTTFNICIQHLSLIATTEEYTAYSTFVVFEINQIRFNETINKYLEEGYQISSKPYVAPQNGFSVLLEKPPSI